MQRAVTSIMGDQLIVKAGHQLQQFFFVIALLLFSSTPPVTGIQDIYRSKQINALQVLWGAWNSTPQLESNLAGWSSSQMYPCSQHRTATPRLNWRGVECLRNVNCVQNTTTAQWKCDILITGLTLNNASIVGILPEAIGNITSLTTLELTGNPKLTGTLPETLLADSNLNNVDLHDNDFYGAIPDFQYLQNVNLGGNRFSGSFPLPTSRSMGYLQTLNLGRNVLEGEIPERAFENLTQLVQLDLSNNRFTGTLPPLTLSKNLQILDLSSNNFTGTLPDLTTMHSLSTLNLSRNAFTGSILSSSAKQSLTESKSLSVMDLSYNWLTSDLDSWNSSELGSLQELYLDHNLINGTLNISQLSALGLLSMKSPDSTGFKLRVLSLKNNTISNVVYDKNMESDITTIIRLQGNPYCNSNDGTKFHKQVCYVSSVPVENEKRKVVLIAVVTSAISLLLLIILAATLYRHKRYKQYLQVQVQRKFEEFEVKPTIFPYSQLRTATRDFHPDTKLGQGAFGAVYKGVLPNGSALAVKVLFAKSNQGIDEFLNEVVLLTGMKHRNLVNLKGCCIREQQKLLVYEYVDNYDLDQILLAGRNKALLSWPVRLKICLGVARGLHYLHALAHPKIIHRDIKASNVLLAKDYETKIADFGLASLFPDEQSYIMTKHVAGTKGYLAPEYASYGQLSDKVDVFSFGVLCLEVVSGRRNIDETLPPDEVYLPNWAWELHRRGNLLDLVDSTISLQDEEKLEVQRLITVSLLCIQMAAEQRPSMERVVAMLQGGSESEAVLKPGNVKQHVNSMRLFAFGENGLGTVRVAGESLDMKSSFMDSSSGGAAGLSEDDFGSYSASVELSDIKSVR